MSAFSERLRALRASKDRFVGSPLFKNVIEPALVSRLGPRYGRVMVRGAAVGGVLYGVYVAFNKWTERSWYENQAAVPALRVDAGAENDPLSALDDEHAWRQALMGLAGACGHDPVRVRAIALRAAECVRSRRAAESAGTSSAAISAARTAYAASVRIFEHLSELEVGMRGRPIGEQRRFQLFAGKVEAEARNEAKSATGLRARAEGSLR